MSATSSVVRAVTGEIGRRVGISIEGSAGPRRRRRPRGRFTSAVTTLEQLAQPETEAEEERRTSYLELFFDLVFVFAVTQVTALVAHDPTRARLRARRARVRARVVGLVGLRVDDECDRHREHRSSASSCSWRPARASSSRSRFPTRSAGDGLWFALAYLVVRLVHIGLYVWGLRDDPDASGGDPPPRAVVPRRAVRRPRRRLRGRRHARRAVDRCRSRSTSPAPPASGRGGFRVSPVALRGAVRALRDHRARRVGRRRSASAATALPRDGTFFVAVAIAFALAAVLWWSYFDFPALAAARALRRASAGATRPARPRPVHVLPLPERARDHLRRRRREEGGRAPLGAALGRRPGRARRSGSRSSCSSSSSGGCA